MIPPIPKSHYAPPPNPYPIQPFHGAGFSALIYPLTPSKAAPPTQRCHTAVACGQRSPPSSWPLIPLQAVCLAAHPRMAAALSPRAGLLTYLPPLPGSTSQRYNPAVAGGGGALSMGRIAYATGAASMRLLTGPPPPLPLPASSHAADPSSPHAGGGGGLSGRMGGAQGAMPPPWKLNVIRVLNHR